MGLSDWYIARIAADVSGLNSIAELAAAVELLKASFKGVEEAVGFADKIRSLGESIDAFAGRVGAGAAALDKFKEAAEGLRNTPLQLDEAFQKILPQSLNRGFTEEATQNVTVMLSKLATEYNTTLEQMMTAYRRTLAGGRTGGGANIFLSALGIDPDQLKDMTFTDVFEKLREAVKHFDELGQTGASAFTQIKQAWQLAFGEEFNNALGNAGAEWKRLMDEFKDPTILSFFADVGHAAATTLRGFIDFVDAMKHLWKDVASGQSNTAGGSEAGASTVNDWLQNSADFWMGAGGSHSADGSSLLTPQALANQTFKQNFGPGWFSSNTLKHDPLTGGLGEDAGGAKSLNDSYRALADTLDGIPNKLISTAEATKRAKEAAKELNQEVEELLRRLHIDLPNNNFSDEAISRVAQTIANLPILAMVNPAIGQDTLATARMNAADQALAGLENQKFVNSFTPYMTDKVNPAIDAKTLADAIHASLVRDAATQTFSDALTEAVGKGKFQDTLASAFSNAIVSGDWSKAFANVDKQFMTAGISSFLKNLVGQDANGNWSSFGTPVSAETGKNIAAGESGVMAFLGGYGSKEAGSGSALKSAVTGAIAGFSSGAGVYGAVVGAVAGFLGYEMGSGPDRPMVGASVGGNGVAGLDNLNLGGVFTKPQLTQMQQQVQQVYDQVHDALVNMITLFPGNIALPKPGASYGIVDDKFHQFSGNWDAYLNGTLPTQLEGQFTGQLSEGFASLGMDPKQFANLWGGLQKLGPAPALQSVGTLQQALLELGMGPKSTPGPGEWNTVWNTFSGSAGSDFFKPGGSTGFQMLMNQVSGQSRMSPGALIGENDQTIYNLGRSLSSGGLSPEDQIATIKQIADLSKQRYDAEKQAVTDLFNLAKSVQMQYGSLKDQFALQGMVNPDGSPNLGAQSKLYSDRLGGDLQGLNTARNSQDLQAAWNKFTQDLTSAEQLGIQGGGDPKAWSQWASTVLDKGKQLFDADLSKIGQSINDINDLFVKQLGPALKLFLDGLDPITGGGGGSGGGGGGGGTGGGRTGLPGFQKGINDTTTSMTTMVDATNGARDALTQLTSAVGDLLSMIDSAGGGSASSSIVGNRHAFS